MSSKTDIKKLDSILEQIEKYMIKLYGQTYQKAVQIKQVREAIAAGKTFEWMDNPAALAQFEKMLDKLARNVSLLTTAGVTASVNTAAGVGILAASKQSDLTEEEQQEQKEQITQNVLDAHRDKATGGITSLTIEDDKDRLSDRVWELTQQSKTEMEIIIQNGMKQGMTADEIARSVQGYLLQPDKLFRRVRNKETGELELSEAAKNYHPGPGVYRSSYMNAMRLARTEVNAAYMQAETAAYVNNPLVIAVKIQRSKNHTTMKKGKVVELHDICDELEGTYPKDMIFTGWHPQCRCFMTPVLAKPADVKKGKATPQTDLPKSFTSWMQANQQRLLTARSVPYFIRNNKQMIADQVDMDDSVMSILDVKPTPEKPMAAKDEPGTKTATAAQPDNISDPGTASQKAIDEGMTTGEIKTFDGKTLINSNTATDMVPNIYPYGKKNLYKYLVEFLDNKKQGYVYGNESWYIITKKGEHFTIDDNSEDPKIKMTEIIYMERMNADDQQVWFDASKEEYRRLIKDITGFDVSEDKQ